jgi:ring-1,2-phenylacetyl-CoA epoxidase subunit PaaE
MSDSFHKLTITSARALAGGAIELTFAVPPSAVSAFAFKPGQHMPVRATIDDVEQRRTYSICSGRKGPLRIGIKHVDGGIFSTWANAHLKTGDTLEVASPQGRFTLPASDGTPRHLLMLAGGSGITPILGMMIEALQSETQTRVTLIYCTRTLADAMFLDEIEDLKDRSPARLDVINVLSGAGEAETELLQGRMTGDKLKGLVARRFDFPSVTRAFLCGPGTFIKETRNALFELGLARDAVQHEFFAGRSGGGTPANAPKPAVKVTHVPPPGSIEAVAVLDGQRHKFALAPGQHVLEAALQAGIKAPYACTGGMCSTCRARVIEGAVTMTVNYSLEDWEMKRGFVLTCQAVATTDTLVVDYDAM